MSSGQTLDPHLLEDGTASIMSVRPQLLGIAYRMLGAITEAEGIVQDAWLRWQTANRPQS